jgi:DNA (cytosine-5)-methyltransferase 1
MKKLKLVELYAGTGRSYEPFRRWRRVELALLVDSNPHCRDSYLQNFPNAPYVKRDLGALTPRQLLDMAGGNVDILLGCPPCQGFSESGLRQEEDPRNWHVSRFARFALSLRPRAVVMENVPRVAESAEFDMMIERLEEVGYKWSSIIANAAQYGSCQSRQRLLFVAIRDRAGDTPKFPKPTHGGSQKVFSYSKTRLALPSDNPEEILGRTPLTQRISKLMSVDMSLSLGPEPMTTVGYNIALGITPVRC